MQRVRERDATTGKPVMLREYSDRVLELLVKAHKPGFPRAVRYFGGHCRRHVKLNLTGGDVREHRIG